MYEAYATTIEIITIIASILAFTFAFISLFRINGKEKTAKYQLMLIAIGYLFWGIAEMTWWYYNRAFGTMPSTSDIFWAIGYTFIVTGLAWVTLKLYKKANHLKRGIALLLLLGIPAIIGLTHIYTTCTITTSAEQCVSQAYSIVSGAILLLLVSIYAQFHQLKKVGTTLTLLSLAFLVDFLADITYSLTLPEQMLGVLGLAADTGYATGYILSAIAFYILSRK